MWTALEIPAPQKFFQHLSQNGLIIKCQNYKSYDEIAEIMRIWMADYAG
jgi:hypothetical protein